MHAFLSRISFIANYKKTLFCAVLQHQGWRFFYLGINFQILENQNNLYLSGPAGGHLIDCNVEKASFPNMGFLFLPHPSWISGFLPVFLSGKSARWKLSAKRFKFESARSLGRARESARMAMTQQLRKWLSAPSLRRKIFSNENNHN